MENRIKFQEKHKLRKKKQADIIEAQKLVGAANNLEDPLANLKPFTKFDRNGLLINIECKRVTGLTDDILRWAFDLTKTNMKALYEMSGWRWRDREKKAEMENPAAWYLIARDSSTRDQVAFIHFRYDLDDDVQVLYCYEIQLMESARRRGLGKMLMQTLELLAFQSYMKKVILTVFNANSGAKKFFMETLKYSIDETSPSFCGTEATYEILSKRIEYKTNKNER